ncbi:transmembrane amino acid transporter protein-domain-containing protein [Hygrophoropsis aurantiaca]|uniref:Transmembrane amino acid transporter protein-domain-containing protein n=1 Tax=Hygrophoropsis aurantiaca TaxID=72124 RepID=A0ACB8APY9_9AGAM|nr:transmembrane amino acid transporter protein-domain-containing protein [Hygrophoropsis aurantiaca]
MTSLPTSTLAGLSGARFAYGSASSTSSVREAIASYRRSQYFAASNIRSTSDLSEGEDVEQDVSIIPFDEEDEDEAAGLGDLTPPVNGTLDDDWYNSIAHPHSDLQSLDPSLSHSLYSAAPFRGDRLTIPSASEATPLLRKTVSFTYPISQSYTDSGSQSKRPLGKTPAASRFVNERAFKRQRSSSTLNSKQDAQLYGGQSTYGQTLFNCIAILLGIGMLSEPLAFAYAGWICGTILIIFYGFITCYTAKILAKIILEDSRLQSYADIGLKAFGPKSTALTSILFCLELFAVSVVLVTLSADSLHAIYPQYAANTYKLWSLFVLVPTVFLPLSILSYTSILGIVSTFLIVAVIFIDGFSKYDAPGSLWSPAETSFGTGDWTKVGIAFGLLMAGFSGHAVLPSLARDMVDPSQFDHMINWAFTIATFIYAIIGYAGYLMFGQFVSDEISTDLLATPGYNPLLNKIAMWMLVISPLTKFALSTRPLNVILELALGLEARIPENGSMLTKDVATTRNRVFKHGLIAVERIILLLLCIAVSILVPEFSSLMAFLGSFSAFVICVIGPISAKIALAGRCGHLDAALLFTAGIMAMWGTVAAFWTA